MADSLASSNPIGWRLVIFTAFFIPLQIIAVALRFYARWLVVGQEFALDDALILVSFVFQLSLTAVGVATVPFVEESDPSKLRDWGKYLLAIITLYAVNVNLPKLAILVLYKRLFPIRSTHIIIYLIAGILVGGSIANVATALAACQPFEANYNPTVPGAKCINKDAFFIWASVPNMITDLVMLILPLPIVWGLHNTKWVKIGLTLTFLVGSFGLATSIIRFTTFVRTSSFDDTTYDNVDLVIWTVTEPGIYLISACLMTYRPLLERLGRSRPMNSLKTSMNRSRGLKRTGYSDGQRSERETRSGSIPLKTIDKSNMGFTQLADEESGSKSVNGSPDLDPSSINGAIKVTTNIENTWSRQ
ncbi:hypothetical protein BDV95DRAFT_154064 [Massariosphaeria phaeospora]|uniref:Rhodopsin domain-containing protein n=1 Tax=Massariosphaeria phaeospora TaxID=100035 RepID=A0A7C8MHG1_9PLEO|nr:hypothetical protein BDV95DRAFT_154064 [Massariosphaeria phaeospora]